MTTNQHEQWLEDRARQATQHPSDAAPIRNVRGEKPRSRGEHYRRRNNGMALRTFRVITRHA